MNRRLFLGSLGAAVVVSVAGGFALSRAGNDNYNDNDNDNDGDSGTGTGTGDDSAGDQVEMDQPGGVQDPTIGTNAAVTGTPLPVVDVEDNDGNTISTVDLIGQPLIINFWFSTCPPCKKELPEFAKVHGELGDEIRFVGINPSDSPETNHDFAADRGVTYELLRDPDGSFTDAVGISAFPVTLFVRPDGGIVRQTGELDETELRRYATELLS